jgi:hypothetical protein
MKKISALLIVSIVAGCATRQLPRATAADLSISEDRLVCLAANLYPNTHIDAENILSEYKKRIREGRFTNQQCRQFYAKLQYEKQQSESASAEAWGAVAYQFGNAIGSRGRATVPAPTYSPTPQWTAPVAAPAAPIIPYTPIKPVPFSMLKKTPDAGSAPWFATCSYLGTSTTIRVQLYQDCPATVPQ